MKLKAILKYLLPMMILLFALPAFAEGEGEEEMPTCETPKVVYLVEKTGAECAEILELHAAGYGFGEIMKAVIIANGLEAEDLDWRDILELRQGEEAGWGQISHAFGLAERFSELGLTGPELLALKQTEDLGWGQIVHAQSIAAAELGLSFEEALAMIQSGMGWGEIRDALELPPGPPPWAGQGALKKNKVEEGEGEVGLPPQAQGRKEDKVTGPPPWAGPQNGDDDGEEVEPAENAPTTNGNGNGHSQGNAGNNGNGNGRGNNGNGNGNGNGKNK